MGLRRTVIGFQSCGVLRAGFALAAAALLTLSPTFGWAEEGESKQPDSQGPKEPKKVTVNKPVLDPAVKLDQPALYRHLLRSTIWLRKPTSPTTARWGTGWVYNAKERIIVTNEHVVGSDTEMEAYCPMRKGDEVVADISQYLREGIAKKAKVLYSDKLRDLALLQVESLPSDFRELKLADKSALVGDQLHSVGSLPEGSEGLWIYTSGVVRQIYTRTLATGGRVRVLEAQMATNRGNSGGPVVNDFGQVVAVVEGHMLQARLVSMFVDLSELREFLKETSTLIEPKSGEAFNLRGVNHVNGGRRTSAMEDYNQALKLQPDLADALVNRGLLHMDLGDKRSAAADFEEAIKRDETNLRARYGLGEMLRLNEKYDEAIDTLTHAIRNGFKDHLCFNARGLAYYSQGKYGEAEQDFVRAIEVDPRNAQLHANRSDALQNLGREADAAQELVKAIELDPRNADYFDTAAKRHFDKGRYQDAINAQTFAIERNNQDANYFVRRGESLQALSKYGDAVSDFQAAVKLDGRSVNAWNRLGNCLYSLGKYEESLPMYARAIEITPNDAVLLSNRSGAYRNLKQYAESIKEATRAIAVDKEYARAYANRGWSYQELGRSKAAEADFKKAAELNPEAFQHVRMRNLAIQNSSGEPIEVYVVMHLRDADGSGRWDPKTPGPKGPEKWWKFSVGKDQTLWLGHDASWRGGPDKNPDVFRLGPNGELPSELILADRVRLWAKGTQSKLNWEGKMQDLRICPVEGLLIEDNMTPVWTREFTR